MLRREREIRLASFGKQSNFDSDSHLWRKIMADSLILDRVDQVKLQCLLGLNFDEVDRRKGGDRLRPDTYGQLLRPQRSMHKQSCPNRIGKAISVTRSYL